jgi:hypothetical protein
MREILLITTLAFAVSSPLVACKCIPGQTLSEQVGNAEVIVDGTATVERRNERTLQRQKVTLEVHRAWLRRVPRRITFTVPRTDCDRYFDQGVRYLAFLSKNEVGWSASKCAPTAPLALSEALTLKLGKPRVIYRMPAN